MYMAQEVDRIGVEVSVRLFGFVNWVDNVNWPP